MRNKGSYLVCGHSLAVSSGWPVPNNQAFGGGSPAVIGNTRSSGFGMFSAGRSPASSLNNGSSTGFQHPRQRKKTCRKQIHMIDFVEGEINVYSKYLQA